MKVILFNIISGKSVAYNGGEIPRKDDMVVFEGQRCKVTSREFDNEKVIVNVSPRAEFYQGGGRA